jgi:hypothetical protein
MRKIEKNSFSRLNRSCLLPVALNKLVRKSLQKSITEDLQNHTLEEVNKNKRIQESHLVIK